MALIDVVQLAGRAVYIKNGAIIANTMASIIMVESESDLSDLTGCIPGSIAYTAGFGSMWQLDADGVWQEV